MVEQLLLGVIYRYLVDSLLADIKFIATISYLLSCAPSRIPSPSTPPPIASNNSDKGKKNYKQNKGNKQITAQEML
jgi:hypothetical protein